ncbi:Fc.00g040750.m01.CDS01 [Cosmosporella sp. VM-42]
MAKNGPLGIASLVLLAGSLVMLFFIILSGVKDSTPLNKTYFLQAETQGITGARDVTQWTYFYFCGPNNQDCSKAHPAPAFGKAWDANPTGAPSQLVGGHGDNTTSMKYYFLWRFGWVFFLMTLFFTVCAFLSGFLACCGRLGAAISGLIAMVALFFSSLAMSIMTATFVMARNAFHSNGQSAKIGTYAFGFAWGSWAALLLATILFCLGLRGDKSSSKGYSGRGWRRRRSRERLPKFKKVKADGEDVELSGGVGGDGESGLREQILRSMNDHESYFQESVDDSEHHVRVVSPLSDHLLIVDPLPLPSSAEADIDANTTSAEVDHTSTAILTASGPTNT